MPSASTRHEQLHYEQRDNADLAAPDANGGLVCATTECARVEALAAAARARRRRAANMNVVVFSSAIALNQSCLDNAGRLNARDMRAAYMALMAATLQQQLVVRVLLAARQQSAGDSAAAALALA